MKRVVSEPRTIETTKTTNSLPAVNMVWGGPSVVQSKPWAIVEEKVGLLNAPTLQLWNFKCK